MVVERDVDEGVVREPEDDVAHGVRLGCGKLLEDSFDSPLVLVGRFGGPHVTE